MIHINIILLLLLLFFLHAMVIQLPTLIFAHVLFSAMHGRLLAADHIARLLSRPHRRDGELRPVVRWGRQGTDTRQSEKYLERICVEISCLLFQFVWRMWILSRLVNSCFSQGAAPMFRIVIMLRVSLSLKFNHDINNFISIFRYYFFLSAF